MLSLELLLVLVLTLLNGALAMSELAVVSSRPARLRAMVERGVKGSRRALALASDPGRFLSTVQIGITLVGVASGAFSGATLGERLSSWLAANGMPAAWAQVIGVGLVVGAITYVSLIVGELAPKRLALNNPEKLACAVAPAMTFLANVSHPVVWLVDRSGKLVLALLGQAQQREQVVTEDEIKALVAEAESAGVVEPGERQMIARVLRLGDQPVVSVMTPRNEIELVDLGDPLPEILALIEKSQHARFPVHEGAGDVEIVGVIQARDLVGATVASLDDLRRHVKGAPVIPATVDALDVVETLRKAPVRMGLVHDEYGHFLGVVTPADLLEAIVGAFADDEGAAEESIVERSDGSLLISGWTPAGEMADALGAPLPDHPSYATAAGFLIQAFGHLPAVGESIDVGAWSFEILDLDGRRIDKILATRRMARAR
ncbi:MAG: hemolysin family protein [Beijerinckiaceae bacterium]